MGLRDKWSPPTPTRSKHHVTREAVDWRVDLSLRLRWYLKVRHLKDVKIEGTPTEAQRIPMDGGAGSGDRGVASLSGSSAGKLFRPNIVRLYRD